MPGRNLPAVRLPPDPAAGVVTPSRPGPPSRSAGRPTLPSPACHALARQAPTGSSRFVQTEPSSFGAAERRNSALCPARRWPPPRKSHIENCWRRELERWLFFYFEPRERMRAPSPIGEVLHIGPMGQDLTGCLRTLQSLKPREFWAVEKALHLIIPEIEGIEFEVNDFGDVELRIREGGRSLPMRVLSEGTLRILGLLMTSGGAEESTLVGIEEPETGVHPTRLGLIADMFRARASFGQPQYIATTHSPVLLDMLPVESVFAVRRFHRHTRIDPVTEWGPLAYSGDRGPVSGLGQDTLPISKRILRGDFGT